MYIVTVTLSLTNKVSLYECQGMGIHGKTILSFCFSFDIVLKNNSTIRINSIYTVFILNINKKGINEKVLVQKFFKVSSIDEFLKKIDGAGHVPELQY